MTVGAPYVALSNLAENALPGATAVRQSRDVCDLVAPVIELQHHDVRLAAVDARMLREIAEEATSRLVPPGIGLRDKPRLLAVAVLRVIRRVRGREARAAPRLTLGLAASHGWELVQRLRHAALRARPHPQTETTSLGSCE